MRAVRYPAHALRPVSASVSGSTTPDMSAHGSFFWTLTANITVQNPIFPPADGCELLIVLIQDGTGLHTVAWDTQYTGKIPVLASSASAATVFRFINQATFTPSWYCLSG